MKYAIFFLLGLLLLHSCQSTRNQKNEKTFVIGFSQCTMADRWRETMVKEMQIESDIYADYKIKLLVKDAKNSSEKQITDIKELISQDIDLLIVSPNESKPITPIIEGIYDSGMPVIVIDRKIESEKFTAYIGADNYLIGKEAAKYAAELLFNKGTILEITGLKGSSPAIERKRGFHEVINSIQTIQVRRQIYSNWTEEDAFLRVDSLLQQNTPCFDLIYAHNDYMARGAYKALKKHNLNQIPIIGIDGLYGPEQGINMVNEGILAGTFLYPTGGDLAINVAINILTSHQYAKNNLLKTTRIDRTNAITVMLQAEHIIEQQSKIEKQRDLVSNQKAIITSQQSKLLISYLIAFVLLGIAFIAFYTYYVKNKSNLLLKEKNAKIEKQNAKIIEQRTRLIAMVKIAENATETKMQFFTNISHEFRTLISLISLPVKQLIQEQTKSDSISETLKNIDMNTDRLIELSEEVLDFRKIEKSSYKLNLQLFDIKDIIENRISGFKSLAHEKQIDVVFKGQELLFNFDRRVIEKVFNNILSNAIKYSPKCSQVIVEASVVDEWVRISVEDYGPGIPEDRMNYIFNRFEQFDFTKEANLFGSGIGLAYTKELVAFHNGKLKVQNKPEQGIIFDLFFPHDTTEMLPDPNENYQQILADTGATNKEYTVLVVEDNEHLRQIVKKILLPHYHIMEAVDGKNAMDIIGKQIPDIVISDILMPKMDGIQLCQKIKTTPAIADIPVILLTALATHEATIEGFETGADAYVTKPFNQDVLKARVSNLLKKKERIKEQFYKITTKKSDQSKNFRDKEFLDNVQKSIVKNLEKRDLTIEDIANDMNMSHSTLYRTLKKATGMRSVDFIKLVRLENAARFLLTTNFNVEEVCYLTGFSDPKYFRKCFISQYSKTPSEFRKDNLSINS
jgi:signal transduction histidine kinase/DNA-binding response OmpR family regulator